LSFTIDGIYGPARLSIDSDTAAPETRRGFRVAGSARIARLVTLTAAETNLPLARIGLFGRASESCELLVSLHKGDPVRIGPAIAEPLSMELEPDTAPAWHRKEYAAPGLLPPQPAMLWLVVQATRGAFWWHGPLDGSGSTQRSEDDGATFSQVEGRPMLHVSVTKWMRQPAIPLVLSAGLFWRDGLLRTSSAFTNEEARCRRTSSVSGFEGRSVRFSQQRSGTEWSAAAHVQLPARCGSDRIGCGVDLRPVAGGLRGTNGWTAGIA
jgi:hypothetical protein